MIDPIARVVSDLAFDAFQWRIESALANLEQIRQSVTRPSHLAAGDAARHLAAQALDLGIANVFDALLILKTAQETPT